MFHSWLNRLTRDPLANDASIRCGHRSTDALRVEALDHRIYTGSWVMRRAVKPARAGEISGDNWRAELIKQYACLVDHGAPRKALLRG
jgi:hypothetical protein